jgi:hypothetical protein
MDSLADIDHYLKQLRLQRFIQPDSFQPERDCRGFSCQLRPGLDLRAELNARSDFRRGLLGVTHIRHVGFPASDYRSVAAPDRPLSLQINLGPRGCRMDLDRYNPYEGMDRFFLHVVREVLKLY